MTPIMQRIDQRAPFQLRPVTIELSSNRYAEGSALVSFGNTRVLCTASVESTVPKWLKGSDQGWVSAEYGMLPRSTHERMRREKTQTSGRTQEISRLIARSLRSSVDLLALKERKITVDCDVLQADGGTRTAAITGGFVALAQACLYLQKKESLKTFPIQNMVSAISVGLVQNRVLIDLCYQEDSSAETDANFVVNDAMGLVEVQGTAESRDFSKEQFLQMLEMAMKGCSQLHEAQKQTLKGIGFFDFYKGSTQ